jgi:hypothetical protein
MKAFPERIQAPARILSDMPAQLKRIVKRDHQTYDPRVIAALLDYILSIP